MLFHLVILALIQGITEFLPISSSGHLVLAHYAMGDTSQMENLTMDVAVHVGTLFAVLLYFRKDIAAMLCGVFGKNKNGRGLALFVVAASVPVIIAGFALHLMGPEWTRSLYLTAWCTLIFGILLWLVDKKKPETHTLEKLTLKNALFIGLAQILALIPGTSRSGITMTAARYLGFKRTEAARFSLLLAIVAISGAGVIGGYDLYSSGNMRLGMDALIAAILSFFAALAAIALMMRWLQKSSFTPFAIYRILLGGLLLALLYGGVIA